MGATPALARYGSHELKKDFLEPSVLGDKVACLGVSEPGGGSDVAAATTTARRVGDDLVINGQKMWITNAFQADWMCLLANTREGNPHRNKSLICLPMDTPGIHLAKRIDKMGMKCSDTAVIYFDDVRVPAKNIIGEEGMGFTYQMMQFQEERLAAAAISLTPCVNIINDTIAYTRERKAFGAPLLDNQYIHFRLAELLREVADSCLQFWGGMGFTNDILVSRYYRDMRLTSIGGGADEVMLQIICKLMGTLPKPTKK